MVISHLLLYQALCRVHREGCIHGEDAVLESLDKLLVIENVHTVIYLTVGIAPHLCLHLFTNLHTCQTCLFALVCLSEFFLLEALEEVLHIGSIDTHALGEISFQAIAVGHTQQIAEGIHRYGIHALCHLLGSLLALALFLGGSSGSHAEESHQSHQDNLGLFHCLPLSG